MITRSTLKREQFIILTCIISLVPQVLFAQFLHTHGIYPLHPRSSGHNANRDIIWHEDFANGIPANWQNTEAGGIAVWEYRGPETTPNNEVGSRGSCQIQGVPGQQILSNTWQNGFIIFDSNYWDNDSLPCSEENFGTGEAPGPHIATLTTAPIDLTNYGNVALSFRHYLNQYTGNARIEITNDGVNWYPIYTAPSTPNPTMPNDSVVIQISPLAGFQSLVQFRFIFEGMYYYWQIDDIQIIETHIHDVTISGCDYGAFDLTDPSHPTGYEYLTYSMYPTQMAPLLKFTAQATNMGSALAVDCALQADLYDADDATLVYSGISSELTNIAAGETSELRAGIFQVADTNRSYKIVYNLFSANTDENFTDNTDTLLFTINPYIYARDLQSAQQVYMGNLFTQQNSYDVANAFLMTAAYTCHSIMVAPATGTISGTSVRGRIYEMGEDNILSSTLIAESSPVVVTNEMINEYGDNQTIALPFSQAIELDSGKVYIVTAGSESGSSSFVCALSGNSRTGSSFVRASQGSDDIWFNLSRTPMVRLNAEAPSVGIDELKTSEFRLFPNPARNNLYFSIDSMPTNKLRYFIVNGLGEMVMSGYIHEKNMKIECDNLHEGLYNFVLLNEGIYSSQKIIMTR